MKDSREKRHLKNGTKITHNHVIHTIFIALRWVTNSQHAHQMREKSTTTYVERHPMLYEVKLATLKEFLKCS